MIKVFGEGMDRRLAEGLKTSVDKVQELQRKLYLRAKSEPKFRFYAVYDKVYRLDVLRKSWEKVRENKGSPGVDGQTYKEVEEQGVEGFINVISEELKRETYKPQPVRRVYIPKADGTDRPLGIPTIKDRVAQMALKIIIEPIFEADFEDNSYGYRPKRSAQEAVQEIRKFMNWGYDQVIDADIKDCFGTIPHRELLDMIGTRIVDGKILRLIKMILEAGVMEEEIKRDDKGTPQGGVISPLLANIYLDKIDKGWKPYNTFSRLVRYADDFVIITKYRVKEKFERIKAIIEGLKLKMKEEKTKVIDTTKGSFDFLGYTIRKAKNRRNKYVTYIYPTKKSENRAREKTRQVTSSRKPLKVEDIIKPLNSVIRGWANYYRIGNSTKSFNRISWYAENRIRKFMRRRGQETGYGYKKYPVEYLYEKLGLYKNYKLNITGTKAF